MGYIRVESRGTLPILRLEDMPLPNTKYHERLMYTKSFRRGQLQAHTWRERDQPHVRLDLYFSEVCSLAIRRERTAFLIAVVFQDDVHLPDLGERIEY